jgi:hypothetical protein
MKTEKFELGQTIESMCSVCETEKSHTIESVTKLGKITKLTCQDCATASSYSKGIKTSTVMTRTKNASPYDRTRKYRKGQTMLHDTFGQGEVMGVVEPQKIDVLFGDRTRRLIHEQQSQA